jgi:hypothetical protein
MDMEASMKAEVTQAMLLVVELQFNMFYKGKISLLELLASKDSHPS